MNNQLSLGLPDEPTDDYLESLLSEMLAHDLIAANADILVIEICPAVADPISAALSRLSASN